MKFLITVMCLMGSNAAWAGEDRCPSEWMGHEYSDSYERGSTLVCDYQGSISSEDCAERGAMLTAGSHGAWCQKFDGDRDMLKSMARN